MAALCKYSKSTLRQGQKATNIDFTQNIDKMKDVKMQPRQEMQLSQTAISPVRLTEWELNPSQGETTSIFIQI